MDAFDMAKNINKQETDTQIKYCPNCGSEMNTDANICASCGCKYGEIKEEKQEYKLNCLKNFILKFGRLIIDIDTLFWVLLIFAVMVIFWIAFLGSFLPDNQGYFELVPYAPLWIILSVILPFILLLILLSIKFFAYLLIDIRDSLKKIEQNTNKGD